MTGYLGFAKETLSETRRRLAREGVSIAIRYLFNRFYYFGLYRKLLGRDPFDADSVYERKWDVLIVLDACRADLFERYLDDHGNDLCRTYERDVSTGGYTNKWLRQTFAPIYRDRVRNTAYITANTQTDLVFDGSKGVVPKEEFLAFDEVWRYAWDVDVETVPPGR